MPKNITLRRVAQHACQAARSALLAIEQQIAALRCMYAAARAAR